MTCFMQEPCIMVLTCLLCLTTVVHHLYICLIVGDMVMCHIVGQRSCFRLWGHNVLCLWKTLCKLHTCAGREPGGKEHRTDPLTSTAACWEWKRVGVRGRKPSERTPLGHHTCKKIISQGSGVRLNPIRKWRTSSHPSCEQSTSLGLKNSSTADWMGSLWGSSWGGLEGKCQSETWRNGKHLKCPKTLC